MITSFQLYEGLRESSKELTIKEEEFGLTLAHYNYAFYEKLNMMGRPKDAYDYYRWSLGHWPSEKYIPDEEGLCQSNAPGNNDGYNYGNYNIRP